MPWFWPGTPPEINEMMLSAGDQAASFVEASTALTTLAGVMGGDAASMSANAAGTAPSFVGAGGTAALAAAAEYTPLSTLASTWLAAGSGLVGELAAAYQVARRAMIPASVCVFTRETAEAWTAANWHGFFTPIVNGWWGTYGGQWLENGAAGEGWETAVYATAGPMAIPPPVAPMMGNPAGVAAEAGMAAEVGAERASSVAMRQSFNGMEKASTTMAGGPQMGGMEGIQSFMSLAQMPMSAASSLGQPFGQAPQILGQFPQMGMGLLGPLMSGSALNAASPASQLAAASEAAKQAAATGSMSGPGAGGAGIGGPGSGATAPMSSYARPPGGFGSLSAAGPRAIAAPGAATGGAPGTSGSMGGGGMLAPHGASERRKGGRASNGEPVSIVIDGERSE
ncbi:PPE domain-containing protein [Mycobacteroides abscessus]|uniref:PPE domain-containing protein n=1 Tax=Mycobacteroides abscessus TaxID=36809 RepID=UPI0009A8E196|nr:PPE domain-containing protein [Mycobacteroides abscessus]SLJ70726.1 putative PPE protein [Mycobacteroides abscessus subsp. abscessus]